MKISEEDKAPSDELVRQWLHDESDPDYEATTLQKCIFIAQKSAAWGREQERASLPWDALEAAINEYCDAANSGIYYDQLRELLAKRGRP